MNKRNERFGAITSNLFLYENKESTVMIDLSRFKAIIFDLDGTLVDSMWIWKQIDIDFLGKRGY